jgi:hypothetical protein
MRCVCCGALAPSESSHLRVCYAAPARACMCAGTMDATGKHRHRLAMHTQPLGWRSKATHKPSTRHRPPDQSNNTQLPPGRHVPCTPLHRTPPTSALAPWRASALTHPHQPSRLHQYLMARPPQDTRGQRRSCVPVQCMQRCWQARAVRQGGNGRAGEHYEATLQPPTPATASVTNVHVLLQAGLDCLPQSRSHR